MKSVIVSLLLLVTGTAMAQTAKAKLNCTVPVQSGTSSVNLSVELAADESVDFVTVSLTGPNMKETLFTQLEKGTFEAGLAQGALSFLVIQEGFAQENGVLKKAGILSVNKADDGSLAGFMVALGNVYPLSCK